MRRYRGSATGGLLAAVAVVVQLLLPVVIAGSLGASELVAICSPNGVRLVRTGGLPPAGGGTHCAACPVCPLAHALGHPAPPAASAAFDHPVALFGHADPPDHPGAPVRPNPRGRIAQPRGPPLLS